MTTRTEERQVVHLVDDDDSFRKAVSRVLEVAGYEVRCYKSAGDFALVSRAVNRQGCLLLDVRMPGPSGLELQEALAREEEGLPIIFLTAFADVPTTVRAMKGGAVDFLLKPVKREALLGAVRNAFARARRAQVSHEHHRELKSRLKKLTPREREVFEGVVEGSLNKQIGAGLGMSERTVKAHRAEVMQKMQASSLAELVRFADELRAEGDKKPTSDFGRIDSATANIRS